MFPPKPSSSPQSEFFQGLRDELPILLGVIPFGMIYGVLAMRAGLSIPAAQSMSWVVFAGSSQFMAVQLVGHATPYWMIVLTIFVVNLRHALYSASIAPYLRHVSLAWKSLLAYLLTDEAYAVSIIHLSKNSEGPSRHWFVLGAGITLWACWQVSTAVGIFLGAQIPAGWSLDFSLALTFIALVVPAIRDRASLLAAAAAGVTAVLAYGLPYKLGLLLAALVGITVGMLVESRSPKASIP